MAKSADAFRTISEVADWLGLPTHVLRFWESKFTQVKPVKRAGGRRYYRPNDMLLLGGIMKLLHDDGMTIKGAQKVLREQGVKFVSGLSRSLKGADDLAVEVTAEDKKSVAESAPELVSDNAHISKLEETPTEAPQAAAPEPTEQAEVLSFQTRSDADDDVPATQEAATETGEVEDAVVENAANTEQTAAVAESYDVNSDNQDREIDMMAEEPAVAAPDAPEQPAPSPSLPSFLRSDGDKDTPDVAASAPISLSIATPDDPSDTQLDANAGILSRLAASKASLSPAARSDLLQAKDALNKLIASA